MGDFVTGIVLPLVGASVGLLVVGIFLMLFLLLARMIYVEFFPRRRK